MVLINLAPGHGAVIPPSLVYDRPDGDFRFYGLLENLSRVAFESLPGRSVLPESDRPRTRAAGARFAVELFQYALFKSIDLLQHSSTEFVKGSHRTATIPPEAVVYPGEKIAAVVSVNRFSRVGQEPMLWTGGWQVRAPKNTTILFSQEGGDSTIAPAYSVEFSNPSLYLLRVSTSVGTVYDYAPGGVQGTKQEVPSAITAYELRIKCYFEFKRKADTDSFQQEEYEKWAMELFAGLQQMVSKVGSRTFGDIGPGARVTIGAVNLVTQTPTLKHPTVAIHLRPVPRFYGFELTTYGSDAFAITMPPMPCGRATIGWELPRMSLKAGESMPIILGEIGKSGAFHKHPEQATLHLALEDQTTSERPIVDADIPISYRDVDGKLWLSRCPIRYYHATGTIDFFEPDVNPVTPGSPVPPLDDGHC